MADANVEKSGYSGFERFLFFVTPIIFTAVLLFVLLLLLNPSWRHNAQKIGNNIPVINKLIPDPKTETSADPNASIDQLTVNNAKSKMDEMKALLAQRDEALKAADSKSTQQQKTIDDLKSQIASLNSEAKDQAITSEAYDSRIRSLADMYGKMTPGKAAPIMESLTVEEASLVLGSMNDNQRGRILEKMTPAVAAKVTMRLKDSKSVQDQEMAALQARIQQLESTTKTASSSLDSAELAKTFSSMKAANAASLLLQMAGTEQAKALRILRALDDSSRSSVLAAMTDSDSKKTAQLVSKLMAANP